MLRRFLKANSEQLASEDIKLVDRASLSDSEFFTYLEKISSGKIAPVAPVPEDIQADLRHLVEGPQDAVLMTSEIMFRRLPLRDFYQNIRQGLELFQILLPDHRVAVILYVRQQKAFVESCYTQLAQMAQSLSFTDYTGGGLSKHLDWATVCDDISAAIGRESLPIRPFEIIRRLGTESFLKDYLSALGLEAAQIDRFAFDETMVGGRAANRGFSEVAVRMAQFTMPILGPKDRKNLRKFLQENYSTEHFPRVYFSEAEIAELRKHYAESNARLFANYIPGENPTASGY